MVAVGIQDIQLSTSYYRLDLEVLAQSRGVATDKYWRGLGLTSFSVPAPDEDVVTMAASAASALIAREGADGISTLIFATETGVDQAKAAGMWIHRLLGLPSNVRVVEMKQACYSSTAAVQLSVALVSNSPDEKVLVVASDIAKYELRSRGEPTQGAGAIAMLIAAEPAVLTLEPITGIYAREVDDFWRPNFQSTAIVDSARSIRCYKEALIGAWREYRHRQGAAWDEIDHRVYHEPFPAMATKAEIALSNECMDIPSRSPFTHVSSYNMVLGNIYTGSLYSSLLSLLDQKGDLRGKRIGLFGFGSGMVGEFFTGVVNDGYKNEARAELTDTAIDIRIPLSIEEYEALHSVRDSSEKLTTIPRTTTGAFRFSGIRRGARMYERCD